MMWPLIVAVMAAGWLLTAVVTLRALHFVDEELTRTRVMLAETQRRARISEEQRKTLLDELEQLHKRLTTRKRSQTRP